MFGLNESTQFYVCQRYVRMNLGINGLYQERFRAPIVF